MPLWAVGLGEAAGVGTGDGLEVGVALGPGVGVTDGAGLGVGLAVGLTVAGGAEGDGDSAAVNAELPATVERPIEVPKTASTAAKRRMATSATTPCALSPLTAGTGYQPAPGRSSGGRPDPESGVTR